MAGSGLVSGVSLRLRDIRRDVGALLDGWGLAVTHSRVVGAPRTSGGGVWHESQGEAVLDVPAGRHDLSHGLHEALDAIEPVADRLAAFVRSGGSAELVVIWQVDGRGVDRLQPALLKRLTDAGLALSLEACSLGETGPRGSDD